MGNFQVIATLSAGANSYINTGLTGGVQYTYRVRAVRGSDFSAYSASVRGTANP